MTVSSVKDVVANNVPAKDFKNKPIMTKLSKVRRRHLCCHLRICTLVSALQVNKFLLQQNVVYTVFYNIFPTTAEEKIRQAEAQARADAFANLGLLFDTMTKAVGIHPTEPPPPYRALGSLLGSPLARAQVITLQGQLSELTDAYEKNMTQQQLSAQAEALQAGTAQRACKPSRLQALLPTLRVLQGANVATLVGFQPELGREAML